MVAAAGSSFYKFEPILTRTITKEGKKNEEPTLCYGQSLCVALDKSMVCTRLGRNLLVLGLV